MALKRVSDEAIVEAAKQSDTYKQMSDLLGIGEKSVAERCKRLGISPHTSEADLPTPSKLKPTGKVADASTDSGRLLTSDGNPRIQSVEDLLAYFKVDTDIWRVKDYECSNWEMMSTDADKQVQVTPLYRIKVRLERLVKQRYEDSIANLCKRLEAYAPRYAKPKHPIIKDPHLMVMGLFDHHFGKLAWRAETGEDYDLKIAEDLFENAVTDLMGKAKGFPVERIWMPLGQDFFHIDNIENTTAKGTPLDADGRLDKVFDTGLWSAIRAIEYMANTAPVDVTFVPGNHDFHTSRFLCYVLRHHFMHHDAVTVDVSPKTRKYYRYGANLLGTTHGHREKPDLLPRIMADEQRDVWGNVRHSEWLLGHFHTKREHTFRTMDSKGSTVIRYLGSLSGTDAWHYESGYIKDEDSRTAQALIYSKDHGHVGVFETTARMVSA